MRVVKRLALVAGAILDWAWGPVGTSSPTTTTSTQVRQSRSSASMATRSSSRARRASGRSRWQRLPPRGWPAGGCAGTETRHEGLGLITTTTTSTPVIVTQVRDGVVMQKTGNSIAVHRGRRRCSPRGRRAAWRADSPRRAAARLHGTERRRSSDGDDRHDASAEDHDAAPGGEHGVGSDARSDDGVSADADGGGDPGRGARRSSAHECAFAAQDGQPGAADRARGAVPRCWG